MTGNEITELREVSRVMYERVKRYENLLVPYELRHDLLLFLEELCNVR